MPELIADPVTSRFNVLAVRKDNPHPLFQIDLPWQRLMEDVVVPYEAEERFFLDGAPIKATELDRIKILLQTPDFNPVFRVFQREMRIGELKTRELNAKNYPIYLESILREKCVDVTAQVISAFRTEAKARLSDRLPDRKALWDATFKLAAEGLRTLLQYHG